MRLLIHYYLSFVTFDLDRYCFSKKEKKRARTFSLHLKFLDNFYYLLSVNSIITDA